MSRLQLSAIHSFFAVVFIYLEIRITHQTTLNDAKQLTNTLTKDYFKSVRPIDNQSEAVEVDIKMSLIAIHDVDEVQQFMSASIYLSLSWTDNSLSWNETDVGISELVFSSNDIWIPNIVILNSRKGIENIGGNYQSSTLTKVKSNGLVTWQPGLNVNIMCPIDVEYFPDDVQTCFITLMPWVYEEHQVKIKSTDGFKDNLYEDNGVWLLKALYLVPDGAAIKFAICIQRIPTFFLVNVLFPVICISVLNILVFKLPPESGEKVSYSITVLLTFTVFLSITSANMPQKSDPMSLLLYYIVIAMMQSVCIILAVLLNLRLYHSKEGDKHSCLVKCVWRLSRKSSKLLQTRQPRVSSFESISKTPINQFNKDKKDNQVPQPKVCYGEEPERIDCRLVSLTFDSILLWVFLLGFALVTVVFVILTVRLNQTEMMGCKR